MENIASHCLCDIMVYSVDLFIISGIASVGPSTRLHVESPLWCPFGTFYTARWVQEGELHIVFALRFHVKNTAHHKVR